MFPSGPISREPRLAIRREVASADPNNVWAHDRLSYILSRLGDLQVRVAARDALASYREAASIAEKLPNASLREERLAASTSGLGKAYGKLGDVQRSCAAYAESVQLFADVVKSSPSYSETAAATRKAYGRCPGANH